MTLCCLTGSKKSACVGVGTGRLLCLPRRFINVAGFGRLAEACLYKSTPFSILLRKRNVFVCGFFVIGVYARHASPLRHASLIELIHPHRIIVHRTHKHPLVAGVDLEVTWVPTHRCHIHPAQRAVVLVHVEHRHSSFLRRVSTPEPICNVELLRGKAWSQAALRSERACHTSKRPIFA